MKKLDVSGVHKKSGLYLLSQTLKSTNSLGTSSNLQQDYNNNLIADNKHTIKMNQNIDYIYNDLKKMSYKEMDYDGKLPFLKATYPSLFEAKQLLAYPTLYNGNLRVKIADLIKEDLLKMTFQEIAQNNKLVELASKYFPELFTIKKFIAYPDPTSPLLTGVLNHYLEVEFSKLTWDQLASLNLTEAVKLHFNDLYIALKVIKYPSYFFTIKLLESNTISHLSAILKQYNYDYLDQNELIPILKKIDLDLFEAKRILHFDLSLDTTISQNVLDIIKGELADLSWKELNSDHKLAMLKQYYPEIYQAKYTLEFNQY